MPENVNPPAMRVDIYFVEGQKKGINREKGAPHT